MSKGVNMKREVPNQNSSVVDERNVSLSCEARYLIDVLRAFLNDREPPLPPENLNEKLFAGYVERQQVAGIVADELGKRPEFFSERLMNALKRLRGRDVLRDAAFQDTVCKIEAEFEENGIRYLPLKGAVMKGLYPQSYQRSVSDYDVLLDDHNISRVKSLLNEKYGYKEYSVSPMHDCLINESHLATIELHRLFWGRAYTPIFDDLWSRAVPVEDERSSKKLKYCFTPQDFYLHIVLHLARHWLYYGATIRMFVDVWLLNKKYGARFDRSLFVEPFQIHGVSDFVPNVERACRVWFGDDKSDETTEAMAFRLFNRPQHDLIFFLDPTIKQGNRLSQLVNRVFYLDYFKKHRSEIARRPVGTRFLWILCTWFKMNAARIKRGKLLRKTYALWNSPRDLEKRRTIERQFGLTEVHNLDR